MNPVLKYLPEVKEGELSALSEIFQNLDDQEAEFFARIYRTRRKDPSEMLIFAVVGLFVVPGLQRFMLGQIGLGILYFLTVGLCFIGSIIDLVNIKTMTLDYNTTIMREVSEDIRYSRSSNQS